MATRSVSPAGPDDRAAGSGSSSFARIGAAIVAAGVVFGGIGYGIGQSADQTDQADQIDQADEADEADEADQAEPGDGTAESNGFEEIAGRLAEEQEAERSEFVAELTDRVVEVHDALMPMLAEVHEALPSGGMDGTPAETEQVEAWRATASDAEATLAELGLGPTDANVAKGTFTGSTRQLLAAIGTYQEALASDDEAQRGRLLELASTQRDDAVGLWTVGAEQLDVVNIAADRGHIHLYLPTDGQPGSLPNEFREPEGHDDHDDHDEG